MLYPLQPWPSSVSAPEVIDPMIGPFVADSGHEVRRAAASRPRHRYTLEYLGKTTEEMRVIRDFLHLHRNGVTPFSYLHQTAFEIVPATNTTPVWLTYAHGLVTGQWVNIGWLDTGSTPSLVGNWSVIRIDATTIALSGSTAPGVGAVAHVAVFLPTAVARMTENTWESPAKLIGPEQLGTGGRRGGFFNFSVQIEETF